MEKRGEQGAAANVAGVIVTVEGCAQVLCNRGKFRRKKARKKSYTKNLSPKRNSQKDQKML
eukprot:6477082-Amphidinium_carterae.1